jgi:sugar lactone lactonase YvrE
MTDTFAQKQIDTEILRKTRCTQSKRVTGVRSCNTKTAEGKETQQSLRILGGRIFMQRAFGFALLIVIPTVFACLSHAQNLLVSPECIVFDSLYNRYLVSNWGNGNIIQMDTSGGQTLFKSGYAHALGNCIIGNTFYYSAVTSVVGLDLATANVVMNLPISGAQQLDGMSGDDSGNLYVVESINPGVYKIRLSTQTYSLFVSAGLAARPQDIILDRIRNRLLVCSWYNSPILAVSFADSSVSTVVVPTMGNFDGLAQDNQGNFYLSSWATNCVHKFDSAFANLPVIASSGHNGPSNLCFNSRGNILAVPNFNGNSVDLIRLAATGVGDDEPGVSHGFELMQNYPNPFNPSTRIRYETNGSGFVSLKLYDLLGREIANLVSEQQGAGKHEAIFDATGLTSGVYFYRLEAANHIESKKTAFTK